MVDSSPSQNSHSEDDEAETQPYQLQFVSVGADGKLDRKAVGQVRSHTTSFVYKQRDRDGKTPTRRRRGSRRLSPGNLIFGGQFDPFSNLPQFSVEKQRPGVLLKYKKHLFQAYSQNEMREIVYPDGLNDAAFYSGMLLLACVHLDGLTRLAISPESMSVKLETIHVVRERIAASASDRVGSIAAMACLAVASLVRNDEAGILEYMMHRDAFAALIRKHDSVFSKSRYGMAVLKAIVLHAILRTCDMPIPGLSYPGQMYPKDIKLGNYEHIFGARQTGMVDKALISPLYNEQPELFSTMFPTVIDEKTRELLFEVQDMIEIWQRGYSDDQLLWPQVRTRYQMVHKRIKALPSFRDPSCSSFDDHVYESCRLTAILMIRAFENSQSWAEAADGTSIREQIRDCLFVTDISGLWGERIGLLYWIALVLNCASFGTPTYVLYHGLITRIIFELAYQLEDWYGAIKPLPLLHEIMQISKVIKVPSTSPGGTVLLPHRPAKGHD